MVIIKFLDKTMHTGKFRSSKQALRYKQLGFKVETH